MVRHLKNRAEAAEGVGTGHASGMDQVAVRPLAEVDLGAATRLLDRRLGGRRQARLGELVDVLSLPGLIAFRGDRFEGVLTYRADGDDCELVAIATAKSRHGVGTRLVEALKAVGHERIWLVTTNDNVDALRFYQRRGFRLISLRPGGVDESRRVKPEIPETGAYGIALRDELLLEWLRP
jgi:ribosomal protein S18 acetylase RimI-like enzyme